MPGPRRSSTVLGILVGCLAAWAPAGVWADEPPKVSAQQIKQLGQLEETAEKLGVWEQQYPLLEDATDNIFRQHGWDSEADQYARSLVRDVGRISPFKPHERAKAFLDSLQVRYGLTHDQRTVLYNNMQQETMKVTMKHLKSTLPIAMEIIRTRASQEPFTAQQVQRWSRIMKPLMDDSLGAVQDVVERLGKTMTREQRARLDGDMKALLGRHHDMEKMVAEWQAGNWNPTHWGLQNDPLHAGAMADYLAAEAEKNARVETAKLKKDLDEDKIATDESTWDLYVRQFCSRYGCTDAQRTQADSILKSSKKEAFDYRNARRPLIEKYERLSKTAEKAEERAQGAAQLERLLAHIGAIFERMKDRLHLQVLTTEQRMKFAAQPPAKAVPEAVPKATPKATPEAAVSSVPPGSSSGDASPGE
jgi:hypothetical protein